MPRILFAYPEVSPLYINGGIGTYVCEAAHLLAHAGWEVEVLTDSSYPPAGMQPDFSEAKRYFAESDIRLLDLHPGSENDVAWGLPDLTRAERYYRTIVRLHEADRYDVIEFPDWRGPGFITVRHKRTTDVLADTRLVVHLHSSTKDVADWQQAHFTHRAELITHFMEQYVKAQTDVVLSPTEYLLESIRSLRCGRPRPLFRNGYPMASHPARPQEMIGAGRSRTGLITVACISRLERRKGQDVLARAIASLFKAGTLGPEVRVVFCGNDHVGLPGDRSMGASLRRLLAGVPNWTILKAKSRTDLLTWLGTEVDLCVVPSRGDNYPNVILEAAAAGCALVCSDAGGIPELIQDYDIPADVFPSEDTEALARALANGVEHCRREPGLRERLSAQFEQAHRRQQGRTLDTYQTMAKLPLSGDSEAGHTGMRVSVIVAGSRDERATREALDAACASDYPDYEVILVMPPHAEASPCVRPAELAGTASRLRVARAERDGLAAAWNAGLAAATGELIVPLDAGDHLEPALLRRCPAVMARRPELSYVTTYVRWDVSRRREDHAAGGFPQPLGAVAPLMLIENTLEGGVAMVRRRDLNGLGGFPENLGRLATWDLWLKCLMHEKEGDVIPERLLRKVALGGGHDGAAGREGDHRPSNSALHAYESLLKDHALTLSTVLLHEARGLGITSAQKLNGMLRAAIHAVTLIAQHPGRAMRYAGQRLSRAMGAPAAPAVSGNGRRRELV